MHLFLARHGETDDNARLVFQGQGGSGLNLRGRAQAMRLAARAATLELTALISSDLERAVEWASTAADQRIASLVTILVRPFEPRMRTSPGWPALLKKLNLTPAV